MWADTTIELTSDDLSLGASYPDSEQSATVDGITYKYHYLMKYTTNNVSYIQAKATQGYIYNTTAFANDIKSISLTHYGTGRATTIYGSANGTDWTQITSGSGSITGDFTSGSYKYFKITRGSNAAYWSKIEITLDSGSATYSVTYDANGADSGTAPTDATAYANNATVTVLGNTGGMTKEHYTFDGWTTESDGTGEYYTTGQTFNITANTTLYAVWTGNVHTVTLPANDTYGEYTMDVTSPVAYNTEVTLTYTPASGYENYIATWSVNGTPISGNKFTMPDEDVTITVSLNEVFEMTLTNGNIYGDGSTGTYGTKTITDSNGKTWNAYAIKDKHSNATSSYHFLQIKAYANSTAYYIQVPEYGRKITKLEMTVSGSNKAMDGGGNSATLFFSASNSTSEAGTGVASGTGASKVTIDCSSLNLNSGYITASGAVRIWDVKVTYDPIRLNGYGYATYAGSTPIDYSDDSKFSAWAITAISGNAITCSKITGSVPAGTGVLLMGTAGKAVEPVVAASGTAPASNMLVGTLAPTDITTVSGDYTNFGLSGNTFKKINNGTLPANKAYLRILTANVPSTAREFTIVFDDMTTGVNDVRSKTEDVRGDFYNLNGQRVATPAKGLYIVNGKKVIIK